MSYYRAGSPAAKRRNELAKRRRQEKKNPRPPTTLDDDLDDISKRMEEVIDEMAILVGSDDRLKKLFDRNDRWTGDPAIERLREQIRGKKLKAVNETIGYWLANCRNNIEHRTTAEEEHYQTKPGTDIEVEGHYTYEYSPWQEGDDIPYWVELELKRERETNPNATMTEILTSRGAFVNVYKLVDGTTARGNPEYRKRPITPMPAERAARLLSMMDELSLRSQEAHRRHRDPRPMWRELVESIAGKGPMKLRKICELYYEIQVSRGGEPSSTSASRKRGDQRNIADMLYQHVHKPIQGSWSAHGLDDTWEIPADWEAPKQKPESRPSQAHTKEELKAVKARVVAILKEMVEVLPADAHETCTDNFGGRLHFNETKVPGSSEGYYDDKKKLDMRYVVITDADRTEGQLRWRRLRGEMTNICGDYDHRTVIAALRKEWPAAFSKEDCDQYYQHWHDVITHMLTNPEKNLREGKWKLSP